MVRTFARPQEAREIESRARARTCGVRVAVVVEARRYVAVSRSEPGVIRTIARTPVGCKHLGAVQRRAAREGWPFDRIVPLDTVDRYMPLDPDPEPDPEPTPPAGGAAPAALAAVRARGRAALAALFDDAA